MRRHFQITFYLRKSRMYIPCILYLFRFEIKAFFRLCANLRPTCSSMNITRALIGSNRWCKYITQMLRYVSGCKINICILAKIQIHVINNSNTVTFYSSGVSTPAFLYASYTTPISRGPPMRIGHLQ